MITGFVMIAISVVGGYYIRKTDLEETLVEGKSYKRWYLYAGILILLVVGVVSIIADI